MKIISVSSDIDEIWRNIRQKHEYATSNELHHNNLIKTWLKYQPIE